MKKSDRKAQRGTKKGLRQKRKGEMQGREAIIGDKMSIRASHILVEKRKQAEELLAILKADASKFADLARQHSTCPSRKKGGDLGRFKRGTMVKEFEEAAFGLDKNQISDIVKTQFGYHIIRRTE